MATNAVSEGLVVSPTSETELCDAVTAAADAGTRLRIRGGGSKDGIGAPSDDVAILDMRAFAGIVDYDPSELVLTAGAGTPLSEIVDAVAAEGQALAFDPFDHAPLYGHESGAATLGGIVGANVSGPRRLTRGAARDHVLGFAAVSGRGERFIGGGRVVKNVTGYDLPKLMTGSWGRLAALTEVTVKVLPRPRLAAMLRIHGLDPETATAVMARAMGSPHDVSAARHVPARGSASTLGEGQAKTELLVEGFKESVEARLNGLIELLTPELGGADLETVLDNIACWPALDLLDALPQPLACWKLSVRPGMAAEVAAALDGMGAEWLMDWAGGLVWAVSDNESADIREIALRAGGHAILVRAPAEMRRSVPAFAAGSLAVAALEERVRRAFDPAGVLETGRF
jgi:glycolate oxidase FAD binding subunit